MPSPIPQRSLRFPRVSPAVSRLRSATLALGALLLGLAGQARAGDLFVNGDFDGSLAPWGAIGAVGHQPTGGNTTPARAQCTDASFCEVSQCVDLSAASHPQTMSYEIALSHMGNVNVLSFFASVFPNASCTGFGQGVDFVELLFPQAPWTVHESSFATLSDTQSVRVGFGVSVPLGSPPMNASLDDARLVGEGPELIFGDDFESGGTSAWTATVP